VIYTSNDNTINPKYDELGEDDIGNGYTVIQKKINISTDIAIKSNSDELEEDDNEFSNKFKEYKEKLHIFYFSTSKKSKKDMCISMSTLMKSMKV
jgi:hypothetical protein